MYVCELYGLFLLTYFNRHLFHFLSRLCFIVSLGRHFLFDLLQTILRHDEAGRLCSYYVYRKT